MWRLIQLLLCRRWLPVYWCLAGPLGLQLGGAALPACQAVPSGRPVPILAGDGAPPACRLVMKPWCCCKGGSSPGRLLNAWAAGRRRRDDAGLRRPARRATSHWRRQSRRSVHRCACWAGPDRRCLRCRQWRFFGQHHRSAACWRCQAFSRAGGGGGVAVIDRIAQSQDTIWVHLLGWL